MGLHRDSHYWTAADSGALCVRCDLRLVIRPPRHGHDETRYYLRWAADEQIVRRGERNAPACGQLLSTYGLPPLGLALFELAPDA